MTGGATTRQIHSCAGKIRPFKQIAARICGLLKSPARAISFKSGFEISTRFIQVGRRGGVAIACGLTPFSA